MENLEKLSVIELNEDELMQTDGGNVWKWGELIWKALQIQEAINNFIDGWNSVECGCPGEN